MGLWFHGLWLGPCHWQSMHDPRAMVIRHCAMYAQRLNGSAKCSAGGE